MKEGVHLKKLLAILLVIILVFVASGCGLLGKAKELKDGFDQIADDLQDIISDDDNNDSNNDDDEDDIPLFDAQVFYPEDWTDVLNRFSEFGYAWTTVTSAGETTNWSFYYLSEGRGEIDGADTEIIKVVKFENNETREFIFWYDDDWNCVKAMEGNQEKEIYEGSLLGFFTQLYVNHVALTKMVIRDDATIDSFSHTFVSVGSEGADLGQGNKAITLYEILSNYGGITYTYGLTEIDGILTYVLVRHQGDSSEEMRFTHLVPR